MGWGCIAQWGGRPPLFANFATTLFPGSLMVPDQEASGPTFELAQPALSIHRQLQTRQHIENPDGSSYKKLVA